MTDQDRMSQLLRFIKWEEEQRDWLREVDWQDDDSDAKAAADRHQMNIDLYKMLILRCIQHLNV